MIMTLQYIDLNNKFVLTHSNIFHLFVSQVIPGKL